MAALRDLLARLDLDRLRRGKQFEHVGEWLLTHGPLYVRDLRKVWLWKEWPGRIIRDEDLSEPALHG